VTIISPWAGDLDRAFALCSDCDLAARKSCLAARSKSWPSHPLAIVTNRTG